MKTKVASFENFRTLLIGFLIVLATWGQGEAVSFTTSIPLLNGPIAYGDFVAAPFDFGVSFSSVDKVTVQISADGLPGSFTGFYSDLGCGPGLPECWETLGFGATVLGEFDSEGGPSAGIRGFGDYNGLKTFEKNFTTNLDFLLDGSGQLMLEHAELNIVFVRAFTITEVFPSSVDITGVTVTVEGTAVPEPASLFLVGSGLIGLVGLKRKLK